LHHKPCFSLELSGIKIICNGIKGMFLRINSFSGKSIAFKTIESTKLENNLLTIYKMMATALLLTLVLLTKMIEKK
jgi:hypothetical protein